MTELKIQHILTLAHLLSKGAKHNFVTVTTDSLGKSIKKSQQAASKHLLELENNQFIERINIRLWEKIGIEGRGAFYDQIGALRDVGQNHILQMLAFIAMEDPVVFEAGAIRKSRAKVLSELKIISKEEMPKFVSRGQYKGYLDEPSVKPDSKTETYFRVEARVENKRWAGVPFYLESGKGLGKSEVEIEVVFRKKDSCLCPPDADEEVYKNKIIRKLKVRN